MTALVAGVAGCQPDLSDPDPRTSREYPSPHLTHAAVLEAGGMDNTRAGRAWLTGAVTAVQEPVDVGLPYEEEGWFGPEDAMALGYRVRVPVGQKVAITLETPDGQAIPFFLDAFPATIAGSDGSGGDRSGSRPMVVRPASLFDPGSRLPRSASLPRVEMTDLPVPSWSAPPGIRQPDFEPSDSGTFVIRLQPPALTGGAYRVRMLSRPVLAFPVADRDTRAIQSVWGDPRGGGRRHEGVDIFAPRHTPVVASAPGQVRRVEVTNLGGRVVWLRDSERNQSIYYAHLQEQWVERGDIVEVGDTLGTVGNSGNARTTPPHLHYGIYRRGRGAVNPFPYLRTPDGAPEALGVDPGTFGRWVSVDRDGLRLRAGPSTRASSILDLPEGAALRVVAGAGDWYRVYAEDGSTGFVLGRLTEPWQGPTAQTADAQGGGR
jgi:hypothetical protein